MLKIVPDTNVLISAMITEGNEYQVLKLAKLGKIEIILSQEILDEFEEVINRPKFGFSSGQIEAILKQLSDIAKIVKPKVMLEVVKDDPDDNRVLECAVSCKADYIVSGDSHLLDLKEYNDIKILSAKEFLGLIEKD